MWLTTWPLHNVPQFAEHATESDAREHAKQLRLNGHREATHVWSTVSEESA
jgi:hypothetical protein